MLSIIRCIIDQELCDSLIQQNLVHIVKILTPLRTIFPESFGDHLGECLVLPTYDSDRFQFDLMGDQIPFSISVVEFSFFTILYSTFIYFTFLLLYFVDFYM